MLNNIIKDLKVNIFDGKQMLIIIAMPVILTVILSFALGGTFSSQGLSQPIKTAVVIEYDTNINATQILEEIDEIDISSIHPQAIVGYEIGINSIDPESILFDMFLDLDDIKGIMSYEIMSSDESEAALENKEISAIIIVPENFIVATHSSLLGFKEEVVFDVIVDEGSQYRGGIVTQIINAFTDTFSMSVANMEVYEEIGSKYVSEQELNISKQLFMQNLNVANENTIREIKSQTVKQYEIVDSFTYYTAAMLCMFMLFSAGIGGRSMLEEKDNLTYDRMKVLGVTYFQMMVSKLIVVSIICLLQSVVMISLSSLLFNVSWGNFFMITLISICSALSIGGLGSFIGAISLRSGNYKVANAFDGALVQVLALLGGSYIPLSVLPKFFTTLAKFTVNGQALKAYIKSAQGANVAEIIPELGSILVFGVTFFIAAMILLNLERRKENAITHMA